jgi:ankyrin repeat protein
LTFDLPQAEEGELVNVQNYRGDTALHYAVSAETPSPALVALLLNFGVSQI